MQETTIGRKQKLSVIIPVYNEEATIEELLKKVIAVRLTRDLEKEIIVVNDASKDKSEEIVTRVINQYPDETIKYLKQSANAGKGMAIRAGIRSVTGDYVIIQDADLEYDPEDYNPLLDYLIANKRAVVYGSRFLNKNNKSSYATFFWGGKLVSFITNILYGQKLTDEPTCYKLFDAGLLKSIDLKCTGFEFCPEVTAKVAKLGHKIDELPIRYYPRSIEEGKKIKWYDGVEAIWVLLKYRITKQ